jgi:16S rRNA (adenine1518-N6/adenine1519-N6)-dimethyltransferase
VEAGAEVWEIGPGLGAMTHALLEKGLQVWAFEIDAGFSSILRRFFGKESGFTLVEGDVMKTWQEQTAAPYLLGNLPYNIAAALIGSMIEKGMLFKRMVVTVQAEVAMRIRAGPGSKNYSSFSALCASAYTAKKIMDIKGASFYPRPRVDSQALRLDLKPELIAYPALFYPLLRKLFSSRRKMIKHNLGGFLSSCQVENAACEVLARSALSGSERAEDLGLDAFVRLAKTIEDMRLLH